MNVDDKNSNLLEGKTAASGLFPQLEELERQPLKFNFDFGLKALPLEPGLILIRGGRQMGKSTWMEQQIRLTADTFGPGSALYLNGDYLLSEKNLYTAILSCLDLFHQTKSKSPVQRIFIDEITAISNWELALKKLYDADRTRKILIVTTGSKAVDLRRGSERLPGRKGKLERTNFYFTHIPFPEFERVARPVFKDDLWVIYLLSGGTPVGANSLFEQKRIPEYVIQLVRDWIFGECALQGRSQSHLQYVAEALFQRGGSTVSLTHLARDAGVANNTVVQGYIDLLCDLLCVTPSRPIDLNQERPLSRKPIKLHWVHTLAALSLSPYQLRSLDEFKDLAPTEQSKWLEWLVAQELWRRKAASGKETEGYFWSSAHHELDFMESTNHWIEVKRGSASPHEFAWFTKSFPRGKLTVISNQPFQSDRIRGITLESFLRGEDKKDWIDMANEGL